MDGGSRNTAECPPWADTQVGPYETPSWVHGL